jgi:hypothetical protein
MNSLDSFLTGAPSWFATILNLSIQAALLAAIVAVTTKAI